MFLKLFKNSFSKALLLVLSILIFANLSGCNEQPTDVGLPLIFDTVVVHPLSSSDVNIISGQKTIQNKIPLFNIGSILLGKANGVTAASILRFKESNLPDSLINLDVSRIKSIVLTLKAQKYTYGDLKQNNLSFSVFNMKSGNDYSWTNKSTWDSIFRADGSTDFIESSKLGNFNDNISIVDSVLDIKIPLTDFSFLPKWIKNQKDSVPIWGLALIPENTSNVIRQFNGITLDNVSSAPYLTVIYKALNSEDEDTLTINSAINASFINSPLSDTNTLAVQGAASVRSLLSFDLSMIPDYASIYKAQLELTYNSDKSFVGSSSMDSVLDAGIFLNDSVWKAPSVPYYASLIGSKYIFQNVISAVEWFVRKQNKKGDLYFISPGWSEYRKLDKISFYGINDPDKEKRPKLIVIYSKRPY